MFISWHAACNVYGENNIITYAVACNVSVFSNDCSGQYGPAANHAKVSPR